jgi:hypothetical protein
LQWYCLLSCKGQATNLKRLAQYRVITQFRGRSLRLNLTISTFLKHPIDWVRTTPIWTFALNRSKFSQDSDNGINRSPLRDERRHHFDWFGGDRPSGALNVARSALRRMALELKVVPEPEVRSPVVEPSKRKIDFQPKD